MAEKDQFKSTISEELLEELFNMFFDSIFGYKKDYENNFNPEIKKEFCNNIKANFSDSIEKKIKEAEEENKGKEKKIKKAMLAFSAMFDEGGIEGYKNELAKKEQSKRLEKVFFSKKGALQYYNDYKTSGDDKIIQIINEKINEKKEYIKNLWKNFESLEKIGSVDSILKEDKCFKGVINYLNQCIDNDNNSEKAKSLKKELTKYKGKDPDALFLKDAVKDFVKYNKENCKIENDKIVVKEGKEDVKIPSLNNSKYFKINEIKVYLEEKDLKLKKFIKTRELILSGNNEIINKLVKEYDKIQNSKYAKKIKEYQKNYSEKKKIAEEITKLNEENKGIIKTIEENEKSIEEAKKEIGETPNKIEIFTNDINIEKRNLKELSFYKRIFGKEAKVIKQNIKTNKFCIKKLQNTKKQLKQEIKKIEKNNENFKKKICESVKAINENYHTGKVELKYKDLKGKKISDINYNEKVKEAITYANQIIEYKYEKSKNSKKLKEAREKLHKEYRKNISSSKKIEKAIMENESNNMIKQKLNIDDFSKPLKDLREITKKSAIKNSAIIPNIRKEQKNTLNQQ